MASLPCDNDPPGTLDCKVFHSLLVPVLPILPTSLTTTHRVEVAISFELHNRYHYCFRNLTQLHDRILYTPPPILRLDLDIFKDRDQLSQRLGSMIARLGIGGHFPPGSTLYDFVINEIRRSGLKIIAENITSDDMRPVILQLSVELVLTVVQHVERAPVEQTEIEWEAINYGMVPAEDSSVKNMIKKMTKVEGGDCMVCLEELDVASDASQMPCSHAFHSSCIETWLKKSHYCPVCRFEMPT